MRHSIRALCALAFLCTAAPLAAQNSAADVIRGRVTDDSARVIAGATVIVTRGPDRLVQQTTTDSGGRYSIRFEPGTGDYLVYVSALGRRSARRRVQRQGTETELVADFQLAPDATKLAEVKVTAKKPERARNDVSPFNQEPGSAESYQEGVSGQLPPSAAGSLSGTASTIAGVTMTPNGPSILGSGAESNLTTLNGMGMAASSIPRAAKTETRVTGATFDATRGGFAGANVDVRLSPGDRMYQNRTAQLTFDPRALQYTDAVGRSAGVPVGGFRGSIGGDGELIRQALTYNVALDVARSISSPATLVDADQATLLRAGISPDSVARLRAVAGPLGLLSTSGVPLDRTRDQVTWLGRLDDTRDTLQTRALLTYAGVTKTGAVGFGPLAAPAAGGEQRDNTLGAQLVFGAYVGQGRYTLNETRLAASRVASHTAPYLSLPGASELVRSPGIDPATGQATDVTGVALGGGPIFRDDSRWTLEGANETYWYRRGSRHRFRTQLWGRADGAAQSGIANRSGTYSFNSIADLSAGQPSSFSRTLSQPDRSGKVWNGAAAFAHTFVPSRFFSVIYGARVEGDGFLDSPPKDAALESALGVRTGYAPSRVHVSPRAGFSYTYNRDKENGNGSMWSNSGRFYRNPVGTLRGGIGEFRDLLRPDVLSDASAVGGTLLLSCVGSAVPAANWSQFASDPTTIPEQCAGGGGALAERAPAVTLISPKYDVPHSWRASLDWSTDIGRVLFKTGVLASYDLSQPGTVDANFSGAPRFALDPAAEGGRTMYVSPNAVDSASGAVSPAESRRSAQYSQVGMRTSDLRGYGGQFTTTIQPEVFKWRIPFYTGLTYTLQSSRRQYRGFDGAAFGDPRTREWAPNVNDARHVFLISGAVEIPKTGTVTLFSRIQSGLPFTPIVQGDVNGDGRWGDRAFIPARGSGDASLDAQLASLLGSGSKTARDCVRKYLGQVAERNGCRGPWTESLNMQIAPRIPEKWARRVTASIYLENVLGGLDQMLHGNDLHGWGSQERPDPVLLVPRGFDQTSKRFRYDVNPRFADTRPGRTLYRSPFRISLDFSIDLAVPYPVQQLRRALEPVKGPDHTWQRRGADSLAAFYLRRTSSVYKALLEESDSLFLSRTQIENLQRADSAFSAGVRALYVPLGEYLAGRGEPGKAELDSAEATEKAYWKLFWQQPEIADTLVTGTQKELFPLLKALVGVPKDRREHSRFMFGHPVSLTDRLKAKPSSGGRSVTVQSP
ncbi:MAG: carboxypeptidase regulatory-like domain-containing protein [Gemmatimonadaceae bacterium]|nr:carboxypeptidase regulatory-like domain-containing protein [Gemmatimonadaceae bacterium]